MMRYTNSEIRLKRFRRAFPEFEKWSDKDVNELFDGSLFTQAELDNWIIAEKITM